mmetsp:Transcript_4902/g.14125  ORF Transcript_4902/g.14125 Transcript_4902/m.14125 type:complete len:204 (+) Transcript_4902:923-1534(+)
MNTAGNSGLGDIEKVYIPPAGGIPVRPGARREAAARSVRGRRRRRRRCWSPRGGRPRPPSGSRPLPASPPPCCPRAVLPASRPAYCGPPWSGGSLAVPGPPAFRRPPPRRRQPGVLHREVHRPWARRGRCRIRRPRSAAPRSASRPGGTPQKARCCLRCGCCHRRPRRLTGAPRRMTDLQQPRKKGWRRPAGQPPRGLRGGLP